MSPLVRFRRFRASFQSRLLIIFTISTGIISAVSVFGLVSGEIRNFEERAVEKARLLSSLLAGNVRLPIYSANISELNRFSQEVLDNHSVAKVTITDHDNRKLVELSAATITPQTPLVIANAFVMPGSNSPTAESALSGVKALTSGPLGMATVGIDVSDRSEFIRSAIIKTSVFATLFWLAVTAACYPILMRVTSSFNILTAGLNSMMEGHAFTKIVIDKDDEAGKAAQAVNQLAATLEEREIENKSLQEELVEALRMEAQEERQKIMAKLIQTNRMTSLGLMISSIAHNINTPNGAIKLAAQHLSGSWKDALPILENASKEEGNFNLGGFPFDVAKQEIKGAADSILNNAGRVERVIQDLRAYNVGERSELSPGVRLNKVVEEALTIIRAHGRQAEVSIVRELADNLPDIIGNQYQLEQVVVNLLLNAMQAMQNNSGSVTIQTLFDVESSEVCIVVKDQGEGLSAKAQKHLFEAFFSTKLDKGGSGLGLYISNYIVSEHGGHLTVKPAKDIGTVATVHLPLASDCSVS